MPVDDSNGTGSPDLLNLLKRYFGYDSFRKLQEDVIRANLKWRDVLVLLPTGGDKIDCAFRSALHDIIDDHLVITYSSKNPVAVRPEMLPVPAAGSAEVGYGFRATAVDQYDAVRYDAVRNVGVGVQLG